MVDKATFISAVNAEVSRKARKAEEKCQQSQYRYQALSRMVPGSVVEDDGVYLEVQGSWRGVHARYVGDEYWVVTEPWSVDYSCHGKNQAAGWMFALANTIRRSI